MLLVSFSPATYLLGGCKSDTTKYLDSHLVSLHRHRKPPTILLLRDGHPSDSFTYHKRSHFGLCNFPHTVASSNSTPLQSSTHFTRPFTGRWLVDWWNMGKKWPTSISLLLLTNKLLALPLSINAWIFGGLLGVDHYKVEPMTGITKSLMVYYSGKFENWS